MYRVAVPGRPNAKRTTGATPILDPMRWRRRASHRAGLEPFRFRRVSLGERREVPMTLRRSKRMGPQIFTDSLADVSMLLVVFFMVTSVILIGRGIDLAMPDEPPPGESVELRESVDVHVLASGRLVVDGRPMALSGLLP
ncbi:MAG TPA: biopolymer transporter ExbD, partial [Acidobacteria bacterium]|nr:biopolymer transporter ExbD [Acidobacteriota bacterium]